MNNILMELKTALSFGISDVESVPVYADTSDYKVVDPRTGYYRRGYTYRLNTETIWLGYTLEEARATATEIASKPYVFAVVVLNSTNGSYIRLENGTIIGSPRDAEALRRAHPRLVTVDASHIAHGGGLHIHYGDKYHWLPAAVVRGHPPATNEELNAAPEWAQQAYNWWT